MTPPSRGRIVASAAGRTSISCASRYSIRSAILTIGRPCLRENSTQVGHARHLAVVAHDLADDAGRLAAGEARQIDRTLGVPRAHEHAAPPRAQREHVPRVTRSSGPASRATATRIVSDRSRAEMPVVVPWRASTLTVNAVWRGERLSADIIGSPSASRAPR